jgi:hypothetical protein
VKTFKEPKFAIGCAERSEAPLLRTESRAMRGSHRDGIKRLLIVAGLSMTAAVATAAEEEEPEVTPYRPTVANSAGLPIPRMFEVEMGGLYSSGGEEKRSDGLPYLLKYAFNPEWGILVGGDLHAHSVSLDNEGADSFGDTQLTLKHNHNVSENLDLGLEAIVNLPTANMSIGSGEPEGGFNGIISTGYGDLSLDLNLNVIRLGAFEEGTSRYQVGWAAATSYALNDRLTLAAEFSGGNRQGTRGTSQFLTALSYQVNKRVVVDGGAAWGIASTAQDWSVFTGIAILVGEIGSK